MFRALQKPGYIGVEINPIFICLHYLEEESRQTVGLWKLLYKAQYQITVSVINHIWTARTHWGHFSCAEQADIVFKTCHRQVDLLAQTKQSQWKLAF